MDSPWSTAATWTFRGAAAATRTYERDRRRYEKDFNIAVCPCVSPWGYECVQRWNPACLDPNRHFVEDSRAEECAAVAKLVKELGIDQWCVHLDLHETTDSDATEFMPARAARDGEVHEPEIIPDGFYLMGNKANPQLPWLQAIIDAVRGVTHVAPADSDNSIMGLPCLGDGIIVSDSRGKGKGATNATYAVTTEVYGLRRPCFIVSRRRGSSFDESRRRRGKDVNRPLMNRGDAAAATWILL